jgi:hypothetical protein
MGEAGQDTEGLETEQQRSLRLRRAAAIRQAITAGSTSIGQYGKLDALLNLTVLIACELWPEAAPKAKTDDERQDVA